jgi:hypothetical protein
MGFVGVDVGACGDGDGDAWRRVVEPKDAEVRFWG